MNRNLCLVALTILFTISCFAKDVEWPLSKCSRNDPDLNGCILKAAKIAVPVLINGDEDLELPKLDPMAMGNFTMGVHKGPINLELKINNTVIKGPGKINITSVNFNKETFRMDMEGLHKELRVFGDYNLLGKLLLIPITSKGNLEFLLRDLQATHTVQFQPKLVRDSTYMDMNIIFKVNSIKNMTMSLHNPHTNPRAGSALNKLLNDNWKLLFTAFTPTIEGIVQDVFTKAFTPLFQKFSYDELLPEIIEKSQSTEEPQQIRL